MPITIQGDGLEVKALEDLDLPMVFSGEGAVMLTMTLGPVSSSQRADAAKAHDSPQPGCRADMELG